MGNGGGATFRRRAGAAADTLVEVADMPLARFRAPRSTPRAAASLALLALAALSIAAAPPHREQPPASRPDPALSPEQVVAIQLEALQHNDPGDHGIATTWSFASPENRAATGPLEHFAALVRTPDYRALLNHRRAEQGHADVYGDVAHVKVNVIGGGGERASFMFVLSRQTEGPYRGCWMTDGVARADPVYEHAAE